MDKVIWFFGPSGAGKTTLANKFSAHCQGKSIKTVILDGDIIREGICKNLGFTREDRNENIRRIAEVCKLMLQVNITPIVAAITPYKSHIKLISEIIGQDRLLLIYVNCPIEVCEKRDPKQLYQLARKGIIKNFTGISDVYENTGGEYIEINTSDLNVNESFKDLLKKLKSVLIV